LSDREIRVQLAANNGGTDMELGLKGKVALVTGSSRGIGRGVAMALAAEGCDVMLNGRDTAALDEGAAAIRKIGRRAGIAVVDLREKDVAEKLIAQVKRELGGLDILVNNAGATKRGDFLTLTDADWEDGYALKFFGHMRLARAAWPLLQERHGSLVSIGGTGARKPTAEFTIGSSVNSAVAAFTKCLADRGKKDGVQVNCIHPSVVETDRTRRRIKAMVESTGKSEQQAREEIAREFSIIRFGTVEDVANLVLFLVSPRGSWMHGATVDLDGGEIPTL
jgi:3-oxoacyl-[acyl-carrier protein] reductase